MSDNAAIYIPVLVGFILVVILIKAFIFHGPSTEVKTLMYYKLDIATQKISIISSYDLQVETTNLNNNNCSIVLLSDLDAFVNDKLQLPASSFLVAVNDIYGNLLKKALPLLIENKVSIIIFLPILISESSQKYQQKQVQQLNGFIFSDEFKNIFSYTQPNS